MVISPLPRHIAEEELLLDLRLTVLEWEVRLNGVILIELPLEPIVSG